MWIKEANLICINSELVPIDSPVFIFTEYLHSRALHLVNHTLNLHSDLIHVVFFKRMFYVKVVTVEMQF